MGLLSPPKRSAAHQSALGIWDTRLDASVGEVDQQISDLERYRGTALFSDSKLAELQQERAKRNTARWQTAQLSGSRAREWLSGLLGQGQLTWDDLGGIDISTLRDDGQLAQAVDGLLKAKTPPPPAPTEPPAPDPVAVARQQAQEAVMGQLSAVQDYMKSATSALDAFDAETGQDFRREASTATRATKSMGTEDAGFLANQTAAQTQATRTAARAIEQKDSMSAVQDFIDAHVTDNLGKQLVLASSDVDYRRNVQEQGLIGLRDEIAKAVNMADTKAVAQLNELNAAINGWQAKMAQGQEDTSELHRILGLAAGIILTGAGAAAAVVPGGQGVAPFLAAGGIGMIGGSAR